MRWILGTVEALPALKVDVVTMTGNVAQVFVDDGEWVSVLETARAALAPSGRLVFESRDPARVAWRDWTPQDSRRRLESSDGGGVTATVEVTVDAPPLVTFRWKFAFDDGTTLTSDSTLRFRGIAELSETLRAAGFDVEDVTGAPDRPGHEIVVVARPRPVGRCAGERTRTSKGQGPTGT